MRVIHGVVKQTFKEVHFWIGGTFNTTEKQTWLKETHLYGCMLSCCNALRKNTPLPK
jgi:hypothetical protein